MRKIKKHNFEAVSLSIVENGMLEVTIVPAQNQPDWIIPTSLIMSVEHYNERIWTYLWRGQEVAVYHLTPKGAVVDTLVILEGNTDVHRLALQTNGELRTQKVTISQIKDAPLPDDVRRLMSESIPNLQEGSEHELDYMYQTVTLDGKLYLVPDLDMIAHRLVDLDS